MCLSNIITAMTVLILLSGVMLSGFIYKNNMATSAYAQEGSDIGEQVPMIGTNLRGDFTSMKQTSETPSSFLPKDYYDISFREIRDAGMNHIRYVFYWESYERDPESFMNEILLVAQTADKWGIQVIYDNHQFHTSSWLNEDRGTGFPVSLFSHDPAYVYDGGGGTKYQTAVIWWTNWWNRNITDSEGRDGWDLQAQFLEKIVSVVDDHPSTLGYEILNEPQIHSEDEWQKIGTYNTFMTKELRSVTDKTIFFSMQIPVNFSSDDEVITTPENLAKMVPEDKNNTVFKVTTYGIPYQTGYQGKKFDAFMQAADIAGVPLYVGEWNNIARDKVLDVEGNTEFIINEKTSDINQTQMNDFVKTFKERNVWGWAYWSWNYKEHDIPNYNLIDVTDEGDIEPTKYFQYLKNTIASEYGNSTVLPPFDSTGVENEPTAFIVTSFVKGKGHSISGHSENLAVSDFAIQPESSSIIFTLNGNNNATKGGPIELTLPTMMISGINMVSYGDEEISYRMVSQRNASTTIVLDIPSGTTESVEISGAKVIPEFSPIGLFAVLLLPFAILIGLGRNVANKNRG